jgi:hypothetical protein
MLADYIATLPLWERDLLAHATEDFCPEFSLHELLQQGKVHILVASDGGYKTTAPLVGNWNGTPSHMAAKVSREATKYSPTELKGMYGRMSLLLFLTPFVSTTSNRRMTCVSRLTATIPASLRAEEEFRTRDVDSLKLVFEARSRHNRVP